MRGLTSPDQAVAFAAFASIRQAAPHLGRLATETDGNMLVETANPINQGRVKLDTLLGRIAEFSVRRSTGQPHVPQPGSATAVSTRGKTEMSGQQAQHAQCDVLRLKKGERFSNQLGIVAAPILREDTRIDTQSDAIPVLLAAFGRLETFIQAGGAHLVSFNHSLTVQAPRHHDPAIGFDTQEAVNVRTLCQQHQVPLREAGEERDQSSRQKADVVQGETVEHLAHVEGHRTAPAGYRLSYLLEHRVVVDAHLDQRQIITIDVREIAVSAIVRTAVGDGDKLRIGATEYPPAETAVKVLYERGRLANHQHPLSAYDGVVPRPPRYGDRALLLHDPDVRSREHLDDTPSFSVSFHFSPQQDRVGSECLGRVHLNRHPHIVREPSLYVSTPRSCREIREKNMKKRTQKSRRTATAPVAHFASILFVVTFCVGGCDSLRFAPSEQQKQNAWLHSRTTAQAAQTAQAENASEELQSLAQLSELQSRSFASYFGLPKEYPPAETTEDILAQSNWNLAHTVLTDSAERPDPWQVADSLLEVGVGICALFGGVYGTRAVRFLKDARTKSQALQEIVAGNELFKKQNQAQSQAFKEAHQDQSPPTRQLVVQLKS